MALSVFGRGRPPRGGPPDGGAMGRHERKSLTVDQGGGRLVVAAW